MLKAIIMDFDGVIVDTEELWRDIFFEWFREKMDYELTLDEFLLCIGTHSECLFSYLDQKGVVVDRAAFRQDTQSVFLERSMVLPLKKGIASFITAVKQKNLKLALATSATRPKPLSHLTRLHIIDEFDAIITAEDVEKIKPEPDLFIKATEVLGCNASEALVIEDSCGGLEAAMAAQIRTVIVPNEVTKHCNFNGCYRQVNSLEEVDLAALIEAFE